MRLLLIGAALVAATPATAQNWHVSGSNTGGCAASLRTSAGETVRVSNEATGQGYRITISTQELNSGGVMHDVQAELRVNFSEGDYSRWPSSGRLIVGPWLDRTRAIHTPIAYELVNDLAAGTSVVLVVNGQEHTPISLRGSGNALRRLVRCVSDYTGYRRY